MNHKIRGIFKMPFSLGVLFVAEFSVLVVSATAKFAVFATAKFAVSANLTAFAEFMATFTASNAVFVGFISFIFPPYEINFCEFFERFCEKFTLFVNFFQNPKKFFDIIHNFA